MPFNLVKRQFVRSLLKVQELAFIARFNVSRKPSGHSPNSSTLPSGPVGIFEMRFFSQGVCWLWLSRYPALAILIMEACFARGAVSSLCRRCLIRVIVIIHPPKTDHLRWCPNNLFFVTIFLNLSFPVDTWAVWVELWFMFFLPKENLWWLHPVSLKSFQP